MTLQLRCFTMDFKHVSNLIDISVFDKIFKYPFNPSLIHQVISSYLINARQGSKAQKSRSEVSGSNKKPWRQKGTGRARAGSLKSPIWRSGGVTFAAKPKKYHQKINKKMYRGAIKSILSKLICDNRLFVIEDIYLEQPQTKLLLEKLHHIKLNQSVLIITDSLEKNLILASRNLYKVEVRDLFHMNPVSLINSNITLITRSVISKFENQLL